MKKLSLVLCMVFILSIGFVGCGKKDIATNQLKSFDHSSNSGVGDNIDQKVTNQNPIKLTYTVNEKDNKINFSQGKIVINTGESFEIETNDLIFESDMGSDIFGFLDVSWQKSDKGRVYTFRGIKPGDIKLNTRYTKELIMGSIDITILGNENNKKITSPYITIYYNKNDKNDGLIFSQKTVTMNIGQKLILIPKEGSNMDANLLTDVSDGAILATDYFIYPKGNIEIFKADSLGNSKIECSVAHDAFIKGVLEVNVIK